MRALYEVLVLFKNQLDLTKGYCAVEDEIVDTLRDWRFGQSIKNFDYVGWIQSNRDSSIERVWSETIFMDERGSSVIKGGKMSALIALTDTFFRLTG